MKTYLLTEEQIKKLNPGINMDDFQLEEHPYIIKKKEIIELLNKIGVNNETDEIWESILDRIEEELAPMVDSIISESC